MTVEAPTLGWRWCGYLLLPSQRLLLHDGEPVELEDRVFDLLVLLLEGRDRMLGRQEIISAIWGNRPVSDATLRQLVYKARRAVSDDGAHQATIHTLYGRSLQWIAPVEVVLEAELPATAMVPAVPAEALVGGEQSRPELVSTVPDTQAGVLAPAIRPRRRKSDTRSRRLLLAGLVAVAVVVLIAVGVGLSPVASRRKVRPTTPAPHAVPPAVAAGPVTIAVLPFLAMDSQQSNSYLSDGITEELINRLGRFPNLRVVARTSSFMFRDKPVNIRAAAHTLGVAYVLEGSVQSSDTRVRVSVELISAKDGYELWSDEYEPASGDVLKVEDEIATAVLQALQPDLNAHELAQLDAMPARAQVDPTARDAYLVGLEYLNRRTPAALQQAVVYFRKAVTASPNDADAWAALAMTYSLTSDYKEIPPDTYYADARAAAERALALDPQLASAHAVMGSLHVLHWQWPQARAEYQRALQLDPSDPTTRQWYAMYLWYMRDTAGALQQMRLAHQLDPLSPVINISLGRALLYAGHVKEALAQYHATIAAQPNFALTHLMLGETLLALKRNKQALQELRTAMRLSSQPAPSTYVAALGVALKENGDIAGARAQYAALQARSKSGFVSGVSLAWLCAELGDKDGAVPYLQRAVAQHDPMMQPVVTDTAAWWYKDPRIVRLRVRMGLPSQ